jgi:flavin reductase (DIM6/NTAB) family NADH-FMN oxidoreductase RutF
MKPVAEDHQTEQGVEGTERNHRNFRTIEPKILYFGTPVALVSSLNEDNTTDLAPISSF